MKRKLLILACIAFLTLLGCERKNTVALSFHNESNKEINKVTLKVDKGSFHIELIIPGGMKKHSFQRIPRNIRSISIEWSEIGTPGTFQKELPIPSIKRVPHSTLPVIKFVFKGNDTWEEIIEYEELED